MGGKLQWEVHFGKACEQETHICSHNFLFYLLYHRALSFNSGGLLHQSRINHVIIMTKGETGMIMVMVIGISVKK